MFFSLPMSWSEGVTMHLAVFAGLWITVLLRYLYIASYNFVHDYEWCTKGYKEYEAFYPDEWRFKGTGPFNALMTLITGGFLLFLCAMVWPLFWPTLITVFILIALRKFIRFKTKVDKALQEKADKDHTH